MLIVDDQAARNFSGNFKRAPSRFCFLQKKMVLSFLVQAESILYIAEETSK